MAEERIKNESSVDDTTVDYLEAIKNLKQNSVDRSKYEELRTENKRLLESLVNGQKIEDEVTKDEGPTVEELRKKLYSGDIEISNLEFWDCTLKLREKLIENGEKDPFLPYGQKIEPTYDDIQAAERVADVVKQCLDYAKGDASVFTNELQRRTR